MRIPFALVGYEVIITNSRYALVGYFITSYPTRAHGIIVIESEKKAPTGIDGKGAGFHQALRGEASGPSKTIDIPQSIYCFELTREI